jgi:hypothetical protein
MYVTCLYLSSYASPTPLLLIYCSSGGELSFDVLDCRKR